MLSALPPKFVLPSLKMTVPAGAIVPAEGVTVVVNVTAWPYVEGFGEDVTLVLVAIALTVCVNTGEMLPLKLVLPAYTAVIGCAPPYNFVVVKAACPLFSVMVAKLALPSLRMTVPVGTIVPEDCVTTAVKVTAWPYAEGFSDDPKLVLVAIWLTICVNTGEVLPAKVLLPRYTAVIECVPEESFAVLSVAWPLLSVTLPRVVALSLNETMPVGVTVPEDCVTVAVKVTDWP